MSSEGLKCMERVVLILDLYAGKTPQDFHTIQFRSSGCEY